MRLAGWVVVLAIVGCGGSGDFAAAAPAMACTPGEQHECSCLGGAKSVQVCNDDGSAYDACECGPADGGGEAGGGCSPATCGAVPNGSAECVDGRCKVTTCLNAMVDCDRVTDNGCECLGQCVNTTCFSR